MKASTLDEERMLLCKRKKVTSPNIPPTNGAFIKHCKGVSNQIQLWRTAPLQLYTSLIKKKYGWNFDNILCDDQARDKTIAPNVSMQLDSCNC